MITFILIACSILALTLIWLFRRRLARRIPRAIKAVTLLTTLVVLAVVGLLLDVVCLVSLIATIGHHRFLGIVLAATKAVCIGCSKPADPSKPNPIQWSAADGILPEPQVFQPRVDHSRTRTWSVERVAWLPWHADQDALRDAVYLRARSSWTTPLTPPRTSRPRRSTAETVLKGLYSEVGWQLTVTWHSVDSSKAVAQ